MFFGGVAINIVVSNGGQIVAFSNISANQLAAGQYVESGGGASGTVPSSGGVQEIFSGGIGHRHRGQ